MSQRNLALLIEYDGTDFVGSQWQNNGRSVQAVLEEAWERVTQERRRFQLAGRTDAGVHALAQVANVRTETGRELATLLRALNAVLPEDVAVQQISEVPYEFHARHSATRRDYRYLLDDGLVESPNLRRSVVFAGRRLDETAMHAALQQLLGEHDFAAFTGGTPEGPTVRRMLHARCYRSSDWIRPLVVVELAANAFLRHMVRNLVGTLLLIGDGRLDQAGFAAILAGRDRRRAAATAAAHGLYLVAVTYPGQVFEQ